MENGQLAMLELGGIFLVSSMNPTWADTLESVVHQATCQKQNEIITAIEHHEQNMEKVGGKWGKDSGLNAQFPASSSAKKRTRSDPDNYGRNSCNDIRDYKMANHSACASANVALGRGNVTTFVTLNCFDSSRSVKTKITDEDSAYAGSEERETKSEAGCSHSRRRGRGAAIHNQSERIDKALILNEVIEYLKQLQAQVQMMSAGNMPILMPLKMQQHLQMSLLTRTGMGAGLGMSMGMVDVSGIAHSIAKPQAHLLHPSLATTTSSFVPPAFVVPPVITHQLNSDKGICGSALLPDPCSTLISSTSETYMIDLSTIPDEKGRG